MIPFHGIRSFGFSFIRGDALAEFFLLLHFLGCSLHVAFFIKNKIMYVKPLGGKKKSRKRRWWLTVTCVWENAEALFYRSDVVFFRKIRFIHGTDGRKNSN